MELNMTTLKGLDQVRRMIATLPAEIEAKVARGAVRAAASVVAEEAKAQCADDEVAAAIKVRTQKTETGVLGKVTVKGPGDYKAPWLEWGTSPHFISVDDSQRGGRGIKRINRQVKEAGEGNESLVIGGKFVGATVWHPGARPHPFMRPAMDIAKREAMAAAQAYVNKRVGKSGVRGGNDKGD